MGPYLQKLHQEHKERQARLYGVKPTTPALVVSTTVEAPSLAVEKVKLPPPEMPKSLEALVDLSAIRHHVTPLSVLSNRRVSAMVDARHMVIYILRFFCGWTHPGIACWFNMDPSSMVYAIQQVGRDIQKERVAHEIWTALPPELRDAALAEGLRMSMTEAEARKQPKQTDWKSVAERLAQENERLRLCLSTCLAVAKERSGIVMFNGQPMVSYIRISLANVQGTDDLNFKDEAKKDVGPKESVDGRQPGP